MSLLTVNSKGIDFNVRIVHQGDKYGLKDCLTHEKGEPLVEFYDTRYKHTQYGQFVSRYNMSSLLKFTKNVGLVLDGGVDDWCIEAKSMNQVSDWLEQENKKLTQKMKI